ncbi:MAG: hypothetical protein F7C32_00855 [Desulfurococcales archaeon]|nr:hypothetical protein [Desulfurococcales archaeon]
MYNRGLRIYGINVITSSKKIAVIMLYELSKTINRDLVVYDNAPWLQQYLTRYHILRTLTTSNPCKADVIVYPPSTKTRKNDLSKCNTYNCMLGVNIPQYYERIIGLKRVKAELLGDNLVKIDVGGTILLYSIDGYTLKPYKLQKDEREILELLIEEFGEKGSADITSVIDIISWTKGTTRGSARTILLELARKGLLSISGRKIIIDTIMLKEMIEEG